MGKPKSNVWTFAKRIDESTAKCNLCNETVTAKGSNTTTVKRHLFSIHKIDVDKSDATPTSASIKGFLTPSKPKLSKARSVEIDRHVAAFIARDGRPVSTVEGEGFRELMTFLEPEYDIKCRTTTTAHIKRMYDAGAKSLKLQLSKAKYVAFTTDLWTSIQNIAYMCVTVHWLTPDWHLRSAIMQTQEMGEKHTGQNLSVRLIDAAREWGIAESQIAATVHDNGANINLAMDLLDTWPDQRCFAHTLQLAISSGLKITAIERMLGAARRLAAHFKRSTVSSEALRQKQIALGSKNDEVLEVIVDCATRWNSTLDMLERLLKLRWAIGAVLSDPTFTKVSQASTLEMTDDNWGLLKALVPILQPLKRVTTMSSGQSYPSVSAIYPHLFIIEKNIATPVEGEPAAAKQCRDTVVKELQRRFKSADYSTSNAAKAAVLDPRYKRLKFFDEKTRNETYAAVKREMEAIVDDVNQSDDESPEPPSKRAKVDDDIFDELADLCADSATAATNYDELAVYLTETPLTPSADVTDYWRDSSSRFPKLATLARKYMCIPATSVPSESAFSTAGFIINRKRASLSPDTADCLIFLNRNWDVCCGQGSCSRAVQPLASSSTSTSALGQ